MSEDSPGRTFWAEYVKLHPYARGATSYDELEEANQTAIEAGVQAAIAAARVPSLVINFDEEVTGERAAEIRKALDAALAQVTTTRAKPPPVLAASMAEARDLREQLEAERAHRHRAEARLRLAVEALQRLADPAGITGSGDTAEEAQARLRCAEAALERIEENTGHDRT